MTNDHTTAPHHAPPCPTILHHSHHSALKSYPAIEQLVGVATEMGIAHEITLFLHSSSTSSTLQDAKVHVRSILFIGQEKRKRKERYPICQVGVSSQRCSSCLISSYSHPPLSFHDFTILQTRSDPSTESPSFTFNSAIFPECGALMTISCAFR